MRRQIPEKLRATRTAFPRTERGNDAVRRSAWKMNKGRRKIQQMEREAVCMIKRTPLLCITVFAGVNHQSHIVELVDWVLQSICVSRIGTMYKDPKRTSHFGTWHLIRLWLPREEALFSSGGDQHRGGYIYLIPNSCILSSAKRRQDISLLLVEESKR